MTVQQQLLAALLLLASSYAAAEPGDYTASKAASVDSLYAVTTGQYLKVLKDAELKSGYPKGSMSARKDSINIQHLDERWLKGTMLQWLILDNPVRLQVSDYFIRVKFPRVSLDERKARALGMYQCMNTSAKLLAVAQKSGARPSREGNSVEDGLRLCALAALDVVE